MLGDPARFTAGLYGPKMEAVTGPVHPRRRRHAALSPRPRGDGPRRAPRGHAAARRRRCSATRASSSRAAGGEIDVVTAARRPGADPRRSTTYFGTPGPDAETQARWARDIFWELFINVDNLAETRERALDDAARVARAPRRARSTRARRRSQAGEDVPDDVLTRLLRFQDEGEPNFHDIAIRHNILGNIVGWIPTVSNSMARAVNVLLEREDELEGAQAAARAGDRELVGRYVLGGAALQPAELRAAAARAGGHDDRRRHRPRDDGQGRLDGLRRDAVGDARRARDLRARRVPRRPSVERLHALRPRPAHVLRPADRARTSCRR